MTLTVPLPVYDQVASLRMQLRVFGACLRSHNDEAIERILAIKVEKPQRVTFNS